MSDNERLKSRRLIYASPLIFGAACALLALIIGVFAVSNFQREKELMGAALTQEGTAILSLVSSGSRDQLRRGFMRGEVDRGNWLQSVQQVIENGLEHPRIVSLYLVDQQGIILADGDPGRVGASVSAETVNFLKSLGPDGRHGISRIVDRGETDSKVFQIARTFQPMRLRDKIPPHTREMLRGRMAGRMMNEPLSPRSQQETIDELDGLSLFLVAELDLNDFSVAVRKQFIGIVVLSIVLLLVGIAGLLSLLMIQGLRITQERLKKMGEFTDVLVSSLPVGLISMDYGGIVQTCNESARQMLNLGSGRIEGLSAEKILPTAIFSRMSLEERAGHPISFDMQIPAATGDQRALHITVLDIQKDDRHHTGKIVLIQDLSQLKKLEAQLQRTERDAAIGRMAAGVAHELRNPLSSIKGLTLLLKSRFARKSPDEKTADLLVDEVLRLDRSISELLDYARPAQLLIKVVLIDELVQKAITLIRADADAQDIGIDEEYQCGERTISVDPDKIIQVILNLCLNSIQAMEDGGRLSVATTLEDDAVVIVIRDTGPGIDAAPLQRIFDPYYTTKKGGTGLGLALSEKIMEDHHGTVVLTSEPGTGTTATLRLPFH